MARTRDSKMSKGATIALIIIFMITGLGVFGVGVYQWISESIRTEDFIKATARVVDYDYYKNSNGEKMYCGIYEYEVNGYTYRISEGSSSNIKPDIGDTTVIKYDSVNPSDAVITKGAGYKAITFFGLVFTMIAVLMALTQILNKNSGFTVVFFGLIFVTVGVGTPLFLGLKFSIVIVFLQIFTLSGAFVMYKGIKGMILSRREEADVWHQNNGYEESTYSVDDDFHTASDNIGYDEKMTDYAVDFNINANEVVDDIQDFVDEHKETIETVKTGVAIGNALISTVIGGAVSLVFVFIGILQFISGMASAIDIAGTGDLNMLGMYLPSILISILFTLVGGFSLFKIIKNLIATFKNR